MKVNRSWFWFRLGLIALFPATLLASPEEPAFAVPGTRVRITLVESSTYAARDVNPLLSPLPSRTVIGKLLRVDNRTLVLEPEGIDQVLGIDRGSIVKLEASRGRPSRARNAMIGAVVMAGLVAISVLTQAKDGEKGYALAYGLYLGAPLGALTGALMPTWERWRELPPEHLRMSALPTADRRVALSLRFGF